MEEKIKKMEEDLLPFGFLSSEIDSHEQDVADLAREGGISPPKTYKIDEDDDTYPSKYL
jgi:hypothetical protein